MFVDRRAAGVVAVAALVAALAPGVSSAAGPCTGPVTYVGVNDLGWPIWVGTDGDDTIDCRAAATSIEVHGRGGDDRIWGPDVWAWVFGGKGSDTLYAGRQGTAMYLDEGDDTPDGDNVAYGGPGPDRVFGAAGNDTIYGGGGDDPELGGGKGHDVIDGGPGDDLVAGGGGDDVLIASAGRDVLRGCSCWPYAEVGDLAGHDVVDYRNAPAGVTIHRGQRTAVVSGWGTHQIDADLEEFRGTTYQDRMTGAANADVFLGFGGKDTLSGMGGNDRLDGGSGTDVLDGGQGYDICLAGERLRTCEKTS